MNVNLKNTLLNQPIQKNYQESQLEDSNSSISLIRNSDLLISIIIPVYNEENSIKYVIERIPNHLNYEIILVDDGSTDKSFEKVKVIKNRHIRVIKHNINNARLKVVIIYSYWEHFIFREVVVSIT